MSKSHRFKIVGPDLRRTQKPYRPKKKRVRGRHKIAQVPPSLFKGKSQALGKPTRVTHSRSQGPRRTPVAFWLSSLLILSMVNSATGYDEDYNDLLLSDLCLDTKPREAIGDTILFAVDEINDGYGDLLFALKLSHAVDQHLTKTCQANKPNVALLTSNNAVKTIRKLGGDKEFNVSVYNPPELTTQLKQNALSVQSILAGPFRGDTVLTSVYSPMIAKNHGRPINLVEINEYSMRNCPVPYASRPMDSRTLCPSMYSDMKFMSGIRVIGTLATGIDVETSWEKGVLLSSELISPPSAADLMPRLSVKFRQALLSIDSRGNYHLGKPLWLQYSHDEEWRWDIVENTPTARYVHLQQAVSKDSQSSQNVLLVGGRFPRKQEAVESVLPHLVEAGVAKVTIKNIDRRKSPLNVLHQSNHTGKTVSYFWTKGAPHQELMALFSLSEELIGVTGDQSFGEALSGLKTIIYECRDHKKQLMESYYSQLKFLCQDCRPALDLLRSATKREDIEELAERLTPEIKAKLKTSYQILRRQLDLGEFVNNNFFTPRNKRSGVEPPRAASLLAPTHAPKIMPKNIPVPAIPTRG